LHFRQQLFAHLGAAGGVVPVEEISARGRILHGVSGRVASAVEIFLDLPNAPQPFPLPTAPADRASAVDGALAKRIERRRTGNRALQKPRVIVKESRLKSEQPGSGQVGRQPRPPNATPFFHTQFLRSGLMGYE